MGKPREAVWRVHGAFISETVSKKGGGASYGLVRNAVHEEFGI